MQKFYKYLFIILFLLSIPTCINIYQWFNEFFKDTSTSIDSRSIDHSNTKHPDQPIIEFTQKLQERERKQMAKTEKEINVDHSFEKEIFSLVNELRQKGLTCGSNHMPPVPPLSYQNILEKSAYLHAKDMGENDYFSHDSQDGRTMRERIEAQHYQGNRWGENIAAGQVSPREVMDSWIHSEGHCQNMMNAKFKEIGVGFAYVPHTQMKYFWVQNFGTR